jgi:hypothetical protein
LRPGAELRRFALPTIGNITVPGGDPLGDDQVEGAFELDAEAGESGHVAESRRCGREIPARSDFFVAAASWRGRRSGVDSLALTPRGDEVRADPQGSNRTGEFLGVGVSLGLRLRPLEAREGIPTLFT